MNRRDLVVVEIESFYPQISEGEWADLSIRVCPLDAKCAHPP
jgi:hypothetical protein